MIHQKKGKVDNSINLIGHIYDKLTVIKRIGGKQLWLCKCECGNEIEATTKRLRQYKDSISCGCKGFGTDFTGFKINYLTVTGLSHMEKRVRFWNVRCDCGNEVVSNIYDIKKGVIKSCGCIPDWVTRKNFTGYQEISGMYWSGVIKNTTRGNGRQLEFEITKEQVWELYEKQERKCKYSGAPISFSDKAGKGTRTASIDRIDSDKGYTIDNIAIVHKDVNVLKMNMSLEQLYKWSCMISETLKDKFDKSQKH